MERLGVILNDHNYLCALCPQTLYRIPQRDLNLFFLPKIAYITVISCGGLLCFDSHDGRLVLCNLTTQQLKTLPPTPPLRVDLDYKDFVASGFGYDSISDDYKVVRIYNVVSCKLIDGLEDLGDIVTKFELYSLRDNSWKEIRTVDSPRRLVSTRASSAFVKGRLYWILSGKSCSNLLEFDLATETFSTLFVPQFALNTCFYIVKIDDDSLGVVLYTGGHVISKYFELWKWREGLWSRLYDGVFFYNVDRPLGLRDGRLLFLAGESNDPKRRLLVYDWITKELKELNIYDDSNQNSSMVIVSYVESQVVLPDGMPIGYYDDDASWNAHWLRCEAEAKELASDSI